MYLQNHYEVTSRQIDGQDHSGAGRERFLKEKARAEDRPDFPQGGKTLTDDSSCLIGFNAIMEQAPCLSDNSIDHSTWMIIIYDC